MNLGQSQFQDTFFVAGAQLTPFRQLRQIELELRSINDAIKRNQFATRRLELKMAKLDPKDPEQAIDLEEAQWDMEQQKQLFADAHARKVNFELMREQLYERTPKEYWEQGFENAEMEHWTLYVAKQIGMSKAMGLPPPQNTVEMWLQLPEEAQHRALFLSNEGALRLQNMEQAAIAKLNAPTPDK